MNADKRIDKRCSEELGTVGIDQCQDCNQEDTDYQQSKGNAQNPTKNCHSPPHRHHAVETDAVRHVVDQGLDVDRRGVVEAAAFDVVT